AVGGAKMAESASVEFEKLRALHAKIEVLLNCADAGVEEQMRLEVDKVLRTGDSVGGVFEVVAHGAPAGLGTYANWDERLDAQLAAAVMSLQAVKAVEIGRGIHAATAMGSTVHDEIGYDKAKKDSSASSSAAGSSGA